MPITKVHAVEDVSENRNWATQGAETIAVATKDSHHWNSGLIHLSIRQ